MLQSHFLRLGQTKEVSGTVLTTLVSCVLLACGQDFVDGGLYYEIITTTDRPTSTAVTHLLLFGDDSRAHDDAAQQYVGLQ